MGAFKHTHQDFYDLQRIRPILLVATKAAFIVYCNAAALPMYRLLIYRSSTQCTAPQGYFLAVSQCSSQRRDGNTTTATHRNADAVDYERTLRLSPYCANLSPRLSIPESESIKIRTQDTELKSSNPHVNLPYISAA